MIFPHFQKTNRVYMVHISKTFKFANRNRYIGFRRHVTELKSSGDLNRPSPNSRLLEEYKLEPKLSIIKFSAVLSGTGVLVNKELCKSKNFTHFWMRQIDPNKQGKTEAEQSHTKSYRVKQSHTESNRVIQSQTESYKIIHIFF